jgi:hypothetical protein
MKMRRRPCCLLGTTSNGRTRAAAPNGQTRAAAVAMAGLEQQREGTTVEVQGQGCGRRGRRGLRFGCGICRWCSQCPVGFIATSARPFLVGRAKRAEPHHLQIDESVLSRPTQSTGLRNGKTNSPMGVRLLRLSWLNCATAGPCSRRSGP